MTPIQPTAKPMVTSNTFQQLHREVLACTLCREQLPFDPKPILQIHPDARILVAGQAPGVSAHEAGKPFADASGKRLRDWMGVDEATFYDARRIAIVPMGFCYPGKAPSGDRPPCANCAPTWRHRILDALPHIDVTLVIGKYAMDWHLAGRFDSLTEAVRDGVDVARGIYPMPHPSPRNIAWFKLNPWFEQERLPVIRKAIARALKE